MIESDGIDDVTVHVNTSPGKLMGTILTYANGFPSMSNAVLCAKASMLLQVSYESNLVYSNRSRGISNLTSLRYCYSPSRMSHRLCCLGF